MNYSVPQPGRHVRPLRIFISYAREDEAHRRELEIFLTPLVRQDQIRIWCDQYLETGEPWKEEIFRELRKADIVLLLISPDFEASEFCCREELPIALERQSTKEAIVIPILLRFVSWEGRNYSHLPLLPRNAQFITDTRSWINRDQAWQNVFVGVKEAINRVSLRKIRRLYEEEFLKATKLGYPLHEIVQEDVDCLKQRLKQQQEQYGFSLLEDAFFQEIEQPIIEQAQVLISRRAERKNIYSRTFCLLLMKGEINYRLELEDLKRQLELSNEDVSQVEQSTIAQIEQLLYRANQFISLSDQLVTQAYQVILERVINRRRYEVEFRASLQRTFPISSSTRVDLRQLQENLELSDEDVNSIENPIISRANRWITRTERLLSRIAILERSYEQSLHLSKINTLVRYLYTSVKNFFANVYAVLGLIACAGMMSFFLFGYSFYKYIDVSVGLISLPPNVSFKTLRPLAASSKAIQKIIASNESIPSPNRIDVAVSVPLTQEGTPYGQKDSEEILRGVALAQRDINADLSKPQKIFINVVDEGSAKSEEKHQGRNVARFLVHDYNKKLLGVIGHFSSDTLQDASYFYDRKKLVAISPTSTAVRCQRKWLWIDLCLTDDTSIDLNSFIFRTAVDDAVAARMLANYAKRNYENAVIFFQSDSKYSQSLRNQFKQQFSDESHRIIDEYPIDEKVFKNFESGSPSKQQDIKDIISTWINNKVDPKSKTVLLVFTSTEYSRNGIIDQVFYSASENNLGLLGGDSMYNLNFSELAHNFPKLKDIVVAISWHRSYNPPSDFQIKDNDVFEEGTTATNWRTAMAYDATQALAQGIEKAFENGCEAKNSCRQLTQEILSGKYGNKFSANGAVGVKTVSFSDEGDRELSDNPKNEIGVLVRVVDKTDPYSVKNKDNYKKLEPGEYE